MNGIIIINKPKGITSSNVVVKVRRALSQKKVGHLGTLDPLAEGVLPITVGRATKLFDYFLKKNKTYLAEFTFGETTDTLDSEGKIIQTTETIPTFEQLNQATKSFCGEINQIPPIYSALSINGVRAYKMARKGEQLDIPSRKVTIFKFELTKQINEKTFQFEIECSSGTYIRALARDLAIKVNSLGFMSRLQRTKSGPFSIENAYSIDQLETDKEKTLISIEEVLKDLPKLEINQKYLKKLQNGNTFSHEEIHDLSRIYCDNKFFGLGKTSNGKLVIEIRLL